MPLRGTKQQSAEDFFSGLWGLFKQGPISYLPLLILLTLCFTLLVRWMFRDSLEIKWIVGSTRTCSNRCYGTYFFLRLQWLTVVLLS